MSARGAATVVATVALLACKYDEVRERRAQLRHPHYAAPELLATGPNQLWSWDITKLKGPTTWSYYYLYVIIDVFSRYVVGWMVAPRESAKLAEKLIGEACELHARPTASTPAIHRLRVRHRAAAGGPRARPPRPDTPQAAPASRRHRGRPPHPPVDCHFSTDPGGR